MKRAFLVGISGQDGTLLAASLKKRGVDYLGLDRRGVIASDGGLVRTGDLVDPEFAADIIGAYAPTHVYYLAAHHHSSQDFAPNSGSSLWRESLQVQVTGLVNILEAMRLRAPTAKLFYASSSHIFGADAEPPQAETTARAPGNVYGITKMAGMEACRFYRQEHRLFAAVGILYNHESAYRNEKFLSQKIIRGALAIKRGRSRELRLGDLSSRVDWGYAPDYVDAMERILDLPVADEYIVATGEAHSVREFVELAFAWQDLDYREWVTEDPTLVRPRAGCLVGDAGKLRRETGWAPSLSFSEMVSRLTDETMHLLAE